MHQHQLPVLRLWSAHHRAGGWAKTAHSTQPPAPKSGSRQLVNALTSSSYASASSFHRLPGAYAASHARYLEGKGKHQSQRLQAREGGPDAMKTTAPHVRPSEVSQASAKGGFLFPMLLHSDMEAARQAHVETLRVIAYPSCPPPATKRASPPPPSFYRQKGSERGFGGLPPPPCSSPPRSSLSAHKRLYSSAGCLALAAQWSAVHGVKIA